MEIAALARQLKDAPDRVARKAIIVQIRALTEQRERGAFTDAERAQLKEAVAALKNAGIAKTDGGAEGAALWRPRSRSFAHSSCARLPKSHQGRWIAGFQACQSDPTTEHLFPEKAPPPP